MAFLDENNMPSLHAALADASNDKGLLEIQGAFLGGN